MFFKIKIVNIRGLCMKIYAVNIEDISEDELDSLIKKVPEEKQARINKFMVKKDKIRALISEILLRTVLDKQFGINNEDIVILKNKYGKPYLKGNEDINFNISHSGDFVVCAVDDKPIGIDIEQIIDIDYKSIAESFFSKDEVQFILNASDENKLHRFYEVWTLKESYIKAKGMGLSIPLNSFCFNFDDYNIKLVGNENGYVFKQFNLFSGYKMAVCSLNKKDISDIIEIKQGILINEF